ncbi:MAG: hypothetical protein ACRDK2_15145 [Solirubrobacteraceae bacterium]
MRRSGRPGAVLLAAFCTLICGCGKAQQDASEPKANFSVAIVKASFPAQQAISRQTKLRIEVRNTGTHTIPNLAVTIHSFGYRSEYPNLAAKQRPVWIVDQGPGATANPPVKSVPFNSPGSNVTATSNTWAAGAVAAGQTRSFIWKVTPVKSGPHMLTYTLAAGLGGKAQAQLSTGHASAGHFSVKIASVPPVTHVDPNTGRIAPGPFPVSP